MSKSQRQILGERIREAREKAGLTIKELSEMSDVSTGTISHIECAKTDPSVGNIRKLADAFGIAITKFIK